MEGTATGLAPLSLAAIYAGVFSNHKYDQPDHQNVQGFLLCLATASLVSYFLCALFLKPFPHGSNTDADQDDDVCTIQEHDSIILSSKSIPRSDYSSEKNDSVTRPKALLVRFTDSIWEQVGYLFDVDVQCLMWSFGLLASVASVFYTNITTILASAGHRDYQAVMTTLLPIASFTSSFFVSVISDIFIDTCPHIAYVLVYSLVLAAMQIILILLLDDIRVIILVSLVTGCSNGFVWSVMASVVRDVMGLENYARSWMTASLYFALVNCLTQYMFGAVYDNAADSHHTCFGAICFMWTFTVFSVLCVSAAGLLFAVLVRQSRKAQ